MSHITNKVDLTPLESATGEIIYEYMGAAAGGTQAHSLAQIILPPGASSEKHYHPVAEESYLILAGSGKVLLGTEIHNIITGDAIAIPPNTIHQISNDTTYDLVFVAVCAPPWTPDCSVTVE